MRLNNYLYKEDLMTICNQKNIYEKFRKKKVLITGATGLIGTHLTDVLMKLNDMYEYEIEITVMCRSRERLEERFRQYIGDVNFSYLLQDVSSVINSDREWNYIIHGASNSYPGVYMTEPVETMMANIQGTMNLLEHAKYQQTPLSRFLFISSCEIYGEALSEQYGFSEKDMGYLDCMNIRSCYTESKRAAETLAVSYGKEHELEVAVARLGYIYGATLHEFNDSATSQFLRSAVMKKDIVMKSDGMQCRSYCYLSDAVGAILFILLKGEPNEAYNVANTESNVTLRGFAEILADIASVKVVFENSELSGKEKPRVIHRAIINIDKLRKLGWEPKVDLKNGLCRTVKILRERHGHKHECRKIY